MLDDDFYRQVAVDNQFDPVHTAIVVEEHQHIVQEEAWAFVPRDPEVFVHDLDGNLTSDGRWTYEWDGENRLKAMETLPAVVMEAPALKQRLEFAYDFQGRRIQKVVKEWVANDWEPVKDLRFVYDAWNMLEERDAFDGNAVIRKHTWGPDLSGSMQGAGGVGGLLWSQTPNQTFAASTDANGNIVAWTNTATLAVAGRADYDPFGNAVVQTGVAKELPFGFSTKYTDAETGLVYYGFRYLGNGRWLNRDPIEEEGSLNLYAFVDNDPINYYDYLGLDRRDDRDRDRWGRRKNGHFRSDWAGRALLYRWITGAGNWVIYDDPDWSAYMMRHEDLRQQVKTWLIIEAGKLRSKHGSRSFTENVNLQRRATFENGEGIIGYEYLHGTNSDVGGFAIRGQIKGDIVGCRFEFNLVYTWNDMIDPNEKYATDRAKALFGNVISLGRSEDYRIWITWSADSYMLWDQGGKGGGWPIVKRIKWLLLPAIAVIALYSGCMDAQDAPSDELALPDRPRVSPSGAYRLVVQEGRDTGPFWTVSIQRVSDGQTVATFAENYYIRHTTFVLWSDNEDIAWVYSGDIGTSYMFQNEEGQWQEEGRVLGQEVPAPPTELRRLRPKWFR